MSKLRILVVEDDKSIQTLYKIALKSDTFDSRYCENGVDALSLYRSFKPEIIVLDIMLPSMTGYSVLKEIRKTFRDSSTIVIMVTSMAEKGDIEDCLKLGIQGYIVKPFRLDQISSRIMQCYQKWKARQVATDQTTNTPIDSGV